MERKLISTQICDAPKKTYCAYVEDNVFNLTYYKPVTIEECDKIVYNIYDDNTVEAAKGLVRDLDKEGVCYTVHEIVDIRNSDAWLSHLNAVIEMDQFAELLDDEWFNDKSCCESYMPWYIREFLEKIKQADWYKDITIEPRPIGKFGFLYGRVNFDLKVLNQNRGYYYVIIAIVKAEDHRQVIPYPCERD